VFFNLINVNKNTNIFVWYHVLKIILLHKRRSAMTRWVPRTLTQGLRRCDGRWGHGESSLECIGKSVSFETHDSYGLGGWDSSNVLQMT
jgi:hypothetical protein